MCEKEKLEIKEMWSDDGSKPEGMQPSYKYEHLFRYPLKKIWEKLPLAEQKREALERYLKGYSLWSEKAVCCYKVLQSS